MAAAQLPGPSSTGCCTPSSAPACPCCRHPALVGGTRRPGPPLSGRELEVLRLLAVASSNQAIARELVVTVDTVKSHVTHLLGKLGAANRTQAVTRAHDLGLLR